jgi:hypothetical protein
MTLTENPHCRALHLNAGGVIEVHRQLLIGPVGTVEATTLGAGFHPLLERRGQRLGHAARLAGSPLNLQACHAMLLILCEPQAYRRAMYP